VKRSHAKLRR